MTSEDVRTALPDQVVYVKCIKGVVVPQNLLCLPQGWHCGKSFTPGRGRGKGPSPRGFAPHLFESLFSLFCPIQDVYFKTMVITTVIHSLSSSLVNLQKI